ncbi:hypothetical protein DFJ63DRAFT_333057 [Scheffersomyces coipomensis]|uniref:uncharacterized protein n=1 Tax=Scheffersomyces coipomensis TaxID=1788519 RepID=UPI00315D74D4
MPQIREIPGMFYDEERGKYFKITNGSLRNDSKIDKYHNNEVQKVKRQKRYYSERDKYDKNVTDLHRLNLDEVDSDRFLNAREYYSSQVLNDDIRDIFKIKTGQINLSHDSLSRDRISWLKQGKPKEIVTREEQAMKWGTKVSRLGNYYFICFYFSADKLEIQFTTATRNILNSRKTLEYKIDNPIEDPYFVEDDSYIDNFVCDNAKFLSGVKFQYLSISYIPYKSNSVNVFKFTTVHIGQKEIDHTYDLFRVIYQECGKISKVRKMFSFNVFDTRVFDESHAIEDIGYINSILKSDDAGHREAVEDFFKAFNTKKYFDFKEQMKDDKSDRTIVSFTSKNEIVFQSLENILLIVKFEMLNDKINFTSCKAHDLNLGFYGKIEGSVFTARRNEESVFKYHNGRFYLPIDKDEVVVLEKENLRKNQTRQMIKRGSDIKKWFVIGDNTILVVKATSICMLHFNINDVDSRGIAKSKSLTLVKNYANDNCNQDFLVVKNHLIFNESTIDLVAINLSRVEDGTNITRFKIECDVKGYYIDNLVDLSDQSDGIEIACHYSHPTIAKKYIQVSCFL